MDVLFDDIHLFDFLLDNSWLWDDATMTDHPLPILEDLDVQTRLSVCLSHTSSLLPWALEEESEKLILSLEAFVKRAQLLREGEAQLNVEGSPILELQKGKRERGFAVSDQLLAAKVKTKHTKASPAPVAAIEWDFQMVHSRVFSLSLCFFPLTVFLSSQMWLISFPSPTCP